MKIFKLFGFGFVLFFCVALLSVDKVFAVISEDEARSLLQRQFIEQSDKNTSAYLQAINSGMSNEQAVESINTLSSLSPNSNSSIFVTGGSWSYVGDAGHRLLVFQPSGTFIPAVSEEKRNMHYTQRRVDGIEEVIDESHGRSAEDYNDAVDEYKRAIDNSPLSGTDIGRRLLDAKRSNAPDPNSRHFDDIVEHRIDSMKDATTYGLFDKIAQVARDNNVDINNVAGYESSLQIPPGEYSVRIHTSDGRTFDANGEVVNAGGGSSGGGSGATGSGGSSGGGGAGTGGGSSSGGGSSAGSGNNNTTGLVPCGNDAQNDECTICHLQVLAMNFLNWLVFVVVAVAALLFVNAGALYVFSPTNPGNISKAHNLFLSALIGLIIVLSAWLIINMVMSALYDNDTFGEWSTALCDGSSG